MPSLEANIYWVCGCLNEAEEISENIWVCWDCELLWDDPMEDPSDSLTFEEALAQGYSIEPQNLAPVTCFCGNELKSGESCNVCHFSLDSEEKL